LCFFFFCFFSLNDNVDERDEYEISEPDVETLLLDRLNNSNNLNTTDLKLNSTLSTSSSPAHNLTINNDSLLYKNQNFLTVPSYGMYYFFYFV
jgi:hypothetical protein